MGSSTIAAPQIDIGMAEVEHRSSGDTLSGLLGRQLHTVSQSYLKIVHVPDKAPASAITARVLPAACFVASARRPGRL
jgi:hypothetical protein